jgi:hypothetical protein
MTLPFEMNSLNSFNILVLLNRQNRERATAHPPPAGHVTCLDGLARCPYFRANFATRATAAIVSVFSNVGAGALL